MANSSAEFILQENIEYNDLVKSIEGETDTSVADSVVAVAKRNANGEETQGIWFYLFSLWLWCSHLIS